MSVSQHTVVLVTFHVREAMAKGASVASLLRRLDDVMAAPKPLKGARAEIAFEVSTWIDVLVTGMMPMVLSSMVADLGRSRGHLPEIEDPWADLDPVGTARRKAAVDAAWAQAELRALDLCAAFTKDNKVSNLREAVATMEEAKRFQSAQRVTLPTVAGCVLHRDRLHDALDAAMPREEVAYVVRHAQRQIEAGSAELRSTHKHRLSDAQWARFVWPEEVLPTFGTVFAPPLQAVYDQELAKQEAAWAAAAKRAEAKANAAVTTSAVATADADVETVDVAKSAEPTEGATPTMVTVPKPRRAPVPSREEQIAMAAAYDRRERNRLAEEQAAQDRADWDEHMAAMEFHRKREEEARAADLAARRSTPKRNPKGYIIGGANRR